MIGPDFAKVLQGGRLLACGRKGIVKTFTFNMFVENVHCDDTNVTKLYPLYASL